MNWEFLINAEALSKLLPVEYARFARPVCHALAKFLQGLPASHQADVMARQAALPPSATLEQRLGTLAQSCPVLHKLGQVLARDQRLAASLRQHLQELESLPPAVPLSQIQQILDQDLGDLEGRGITLTPPAIAEASVAVVIPFRYRQPRHGVLHGVFKILKPGIEQRLDEELQLLETVGADLDQRCEELDIPHLDYREAFQQVRERLVGEIRLDQEQRHLAEAAEVYGDERRVQVPRLLPECSRRITAMERVFGVKVTDSTAAGSTEARRMAALIVEALIAQPVFSPATRAVFHGDPHAGNLFHTEDGRLAVLDWSLVASLSDTVRSAMMQMMLGVLTLDEERVISVLEQLAERPCLDQAALHHVVRARLRRIQHGEFPGLVWLVGTLDEAVGKARLRVGGDLMLFRKSLHTLEGVTAELAGTDFRTDEVLLREFLCHFAQEWPTRWISWPHRPGCATRISNADLARTVLSLPWTAARFWFEHTRNLLHDCPTDPQTTSDA